jgi:hypothetical protein
MKILRIIVATAIAVVVFKEVGLVAVGLLAIAAQLAAVLIRRRRTRAQ